MGWQRDLELLRREIYREQALRDTEEMLSEIIRLESVLAGNNDSTLLNKS